MANGQMQRLLEFANQQMAAEAFLSQQQDPVPNLPPQQDVKARLEIGNTHAGKFMPVQAEQFTDPITGYQVLAQYRNDPTKPSGLAVDEAFRFGVKAEARGPAAGAKENQSES